MFNKDTKYLSIPIIILIISVFLGTSEKFSLVESDSLLKTVILDNKKCQPPSIESDATAASTACMTAIRP